MQQTQTDYELISLEQAKDGFREFISCWLLKTNASDHSDGIVLVDPGPACSIPFLSEELKRKGITRLEGILLTHIHLDHAGGIGHLVEAFPTRWVCAHPKAHKHLIDPSRLWEGSLKVLGELANFYGELKPVPQDLIQFTPHIPLASGESIKVIDTAGHAPHHLSFFWHDYLFAGETAGVRYRLDDNKLYIRPATPPRFLPDIFLSSIERLVEDPDLPPNLCFGHFGIEPNAKHLLKEAKKQTILWMDTIKNLLDASEDEIRNALKQVDLRFALFDQLPTDIQEREKYFVSNSIKGMRQYFVKKKT